MWGKIALTQMCFSLKVCMCTRLCACMNGWKCVYMSLYVCVYFCEAVVVLRFLHHSIQYICPSPAVSHLFVLLFSHHSKEGTAPCVWDESCMYPRVNALHKLHLTTWVTTSVRQNLVRSQKTFREMKQMCKRQAGEKTHNPNWEESICVSDYS